MCWCYYAAVLTLLSLCSVFAQDCTPASGLSFYELLPLPITSDRFTNNVSTLGPSCSQKPSTGVWKCFPNNPLPVLIDGHLGEIQSPPNVSAIHAWSRSQQQTVTVTFHYSSANTQVRHIRLYFYHFPSMRIGLPDIAITAGTSQSYYVTGNQNLRSTDAQRRMVVLSFINTLVMGQRYKIQFTFGTSSKVDWLLLSEVEMCTQPNTVLTPTVAPELVPTVPVVRSSDNVSPNLTLSCTVNGEGRFGWQWSGPQNPEKVWSSDFTRTSTAEFTRIRGLTSADTGFSCWATYNPTIAGSNFSISVLKNLDVVLDFAITTNTTNVMVPIGNMVSLSCEVSGYLQGPIPDFIWLGKNNVLLQNGSIYAITTTDGNGYLQNGGSSPVPSIVSHISFAVNTFMQNESYSCEFQGKEQNLFVSTIPPISGTVTEVPRKSSSDVLIATISVIVVFILMAAVIICIVMIVLSLKNWKRKTSSFSDPKYQHPSNMDKEIAFMKESVAYDVVTEAQEPYVMSKCCVYDLNSYKIPSDVEKETIFMKESVAYGVVTEAQEPYVVSKCSAYDL